MKEQIIIPRDKLYYLVKIIKNIRKRVDGTDRKKDLKNRAITFQKLLHHDIDDLIDWYKEEYKNELKQTLK